MPAVIYSPQAEDDLAEIALFVAQDKPLAARKLVESLRERCELAADHPETGEARPEFGVAGCRSISFKTYVLYFRTASNGIELLRIIHGSRDIKQL